MSATRKVPAHAIERPSWRRIRLRRNESLWMASSWGGVGEDMRRENAGWSDADNSDCVSIGHAWGIAPSPPRNANRANALPPGRWLFCAPGLLRRDDSHGRNDDRGRDERP